MRNMSKVRDVLIHVSIGTAERKRICHHNRKEHSILKGTSCLEIKDPATGGVKNYCPECAAEILAKAKLRVTELEQGIAV